MKELLDRINVFELKVLQAVKTIQRLKKENEILFKENFRLKEEINQLSNKVIHGPDNLEGPAIDKNSHFNSRIDIEKVQKELDKCLSDLELCIKMVDK